MSKNKFHVSLYAMGAPLPPVRYVPVSRIEQLFLLACKQGARTPDAWARFAWDTLAGSAVDKPRVADILVEALSFLQRLPHLVALKLIDEA